MSTAPRQVQQTYYVTLPALAEPFDGPVRPVSRLLEIPEDELRQRLASPACQVLRRFANRANAEGLRNQLRALGLDTYLMNDAEIGGHLFLWVETANQGAGGFALCDFGGQPLYCPFGDIMAVTAGTVVRANGNITRLIDIHRRSTPITPRLDAGLFDFSRTMNRDGATDRDFLEHLAVVADLEFDDRFDNLGGMINAAVRALATRPGEYQPPADRLGAAYDRPALDAFNVYSMMERGTRVMIEEKKSGRLTMPSGPPSATL